MAMLTGKPSYLDQPRWRETPFLSREKTCLDELTDPFSINSPPKEVDTTNITASQRMMRILHNTQRLCSPIQPRLSPENMGEASRCILSDADNLLAQDSKSFRMALQCVFAIHLVVLHTPYQLLRQHAEHVFYYWHNYLGL